MSTREDYERAADTLAARAHGFLSYAATHHEIGTGLIESALVGADLLREAAERMTWRPIETAPLSDALPWRGKQIRILVATDKGRVFETARSSLGVANCISDTATHWLPLPPAPQGEPEEER